MDHIAHLEDGLDGRAFSPHRSQPADRRRGDRHLRPRRARAAVLGPAPGGRRSTWPTPLAAPGVAGRSAAGDRGHRPRARRLRDPAARSSPTSTTRPTSTPARPRRRSRGPASRCRRSSPTPTSSGTTGSATSTPTSSATARWSAPCGGGRGVVGGATEVLEQQIPDEVLRARPAPPRRRLARAGGPRARRHGHRRLVGHRPVGGDEDRRRRRHRAARRPHRREARGDAGTQIEAGGGIAHVHRCDLSDTGRHRPDGRRGPRRSTATSTSSSTTRAARSGARSRSPTTASTTSSGRCSSTTSGRCG